MTAARQFPPLTRVCICENGYCRAEWMLNDICDYFQAEDTKHTHKHSMVGLSKSIFSFHLLSPIIYLSCHRLSLKLHSLIYSAVPERVWAPRVHWEYLWMKNGFVLICDELGPKTPGARVCAERFEYEGKQTGHINTLIVPQHHPSFLTGCL